jgi:hypothetical protein
MPIAAAQSSLSTYLTNCSAIISREATSQLICGRRNVTKTLSVRFFSLSAQPSYGKHLAILHNTLLKLAEKDSKSWIWLENDDSTQLRKGEGQEIPAA